MRFLLPVLAALPLLVASSDADAGTLTISKRGLMPAFAWVDGESVGKVRNRRPLELDLDSGEHEVWLAIERGGTVTRCFGLVDTTGPGATVEITDMRGCDGLTEGYGRGADSAFRGSSVDFTMTNVEGWVQVDGGQPLALPNMPFMLNLDPGTHTIVLWRDNMMESVIDQGTVTLAKGQRLPVTCTPGGCMGFDQAPQVIQVFNVAPPAAAATTTTTSTAPGGINIDVNVPGMSMDVNLPADVTTTTTTSSSTTVNGMPAGSQSSSTTSGNSSMSCCVNDAYYDCPDADAVYQCSGAFMACMMDCGMMDMECPERCMDSHPLDPSRCSRSPSKDNTCSQ